MGCGEESKEAKKEDGDTEMLMAHTKPRSVVAKTLKGGVFKHAWDTALGSSRGKCPWSGFTAEFPGLV